MRRLMLVLAAPVLAGVVHAQTLDSLVHEAMQSNPQVQSFRYRREAAERRADAAGALPSPSLGIEFNQIPSTSAAFVNDAVSNGLSLSQMFMLGGKLSAMAEVERRTGNVLSQEQAAFEVELRGRIHMAYNQLWFLERQVGVLRQMLALLHDLITAMQSYVHTNRMRQADLLSVQAEAVSARALLEDKVSLRAALESTLHGLIGRNEPQVPITTDSLFRQPLPDSIRSSLVSLVASRNPTLLAMDRMKEMNEAMISAARRELFPDLMVQGMVMRMPNGMLLTGGARSMDAIQRSVAGMPMQRTEWMYSLMVSITLPFMPWAAERSTAQQEELRLTNLGLDAERDAMTREMTASLRSAMVRYTAKDSLARLYAARILPLVRRSAEAQTVAYLHGQVPVTTVLDARRMELRRQEEYFRMVMERQMALAEIEMMIGSPLNRRH